MGIVDLRRPRAKAKPPPRDEESTDITDVGSKVAALHANAAPPVIREAPHIDMTEHGGRYLCWQCHYPHYPESY